MASSDSTIRKDHKAVFTRSKTGCNTCRFRKKKCDEAKPECTNCKRNNYACEYQSKRWITEADNYQKFSVTIPTSQAPTLPVSIESLSTYNVPDPFPQEQYLLPPIVGGPHTWKTNSQLLYAPSTAAQFSSEDAARLTLRNSVSNSEKEKMLAGKIFFPFDWELVLDRERCNAASWRFQNPINAGLRRDHSHLFRDILQPTRLASPANPRGYVGERCVVDAPFTCDYGYNIAIGNDVRIGRNCTILDCSEVKIGDRCIIGPNVSIVTTTVPIDPKKRLGSNGPNQGKPVKIEEDCFIGANVTILPGRTVHKGSTVGACSVVTRDVAQFTVVGGNPARFIRAVFQ
ncbi:hypothetical protein O988_06364 [Pseudogymnoascus sp. VKM F-3808]|nr:hypothetical protein O988_06364 [Pseudogymnoascus sp. VKM F-3808]